GHYVAVTYKF
ncbi:hypothetical protein JV197_10555, partial [Vibrio furnissii]